MDPKLEKEVLEYVNESVRREPGSHMMESAKEKRSLVNLAGGKFNIHRA